LDRTTHVDTNNNITEGLMNLIEFLREKLTASVTEKVSNFLGEPQQNVETAMQAVLPTILGGLVQQGTSDEGAKKIMDIIKDGGHTGDILNNLSGLLDNFDKSQLLVTIGTNIFNHFFGNTSSILIDKVANLGDIKNSSAASLLGLTAPMVLGVIGYVVQKENLGISGLKSLLDEQRDVVSKALPPVIAPHLPLRSISPVQEEERVIPPSKVEKTVQAKKVESKTPDKSKSFVNNLLPWVFLVILALLSAYYLRSCQVDSDDVNSSVMLEGDSLVNGETSGIIDDSADIAYDDDDVILDTPSERSTSTSPSQPQRRNSEPTASERNSVSRRTSSSPNRSIDSSGSTLSAWALRNSRSWMNVSSGTFSSNNAEVKNFGEINTIASYLQQNSTATVSIAPAGSGRVAEDRAYAVREQLYQKGVAISRIIIEPQRRSGGGVSIKLNR
jgi:hypothetical protein